VAIGAPRIAILRPTSTRRGCRRLNRILREKNESFAGKVEVLNLIEEREMIEDMTSSPDMGGRGRRASSGRALFCLI
jgi:hypothetical protein